MNRHRTAVSQIAATVRAFFDRGQPFRVNHGSSNTTRRLPAGSRAVDISALNNVLAVDAQKRTALVEPNVPMDRLVEATLPHGLVPPVVMEFPGITAGGGFAGTGGESSSFRHGFFDETVRRAEMVLADGEVVEATGQPDDPRADLFRGAPGAVGTLGLATLLELELVPAKKFVRTTYRRTRSVAEAVEAVKEEVARPGNDYVDGILFSKDHGAVITGELTDTLPESARPQTFSGAWDPWYYMHVQSRTDFPAGRNGDGDGSETVTEYIPLAEYLFRYDRGGFWVGRCAFRYFEPWVPFTRLTRWFLDDFLHTRMLYRALHASGEDRVVVQDLALPFATAEQFVDYTARECGIWPLWLCPLRRPAADRPHTFHPVTRRETGDAADETQMLNIGLWGDGSTDKKVARAKNRALEAKLRELGGMKWLYARTYYDEPEFWDVYGGKGWYDELRTKYKAGTLPTVYDKVKVKGEEEGGKKLSLGDRVKLTRPFGGLYGVYKGIQSKDYFLHRNATWKWKI